MKKAIILILIFFFIIIGCSKEEDPFAPQSGSKSGDINIQIIPARFSYYGSYPDPGDFEVYFYTDSPLILSYKVYSSWSISLPLNQWNEPGTNFDPQHSPYMQFEGILYYSADENIPLPNSYLGGNPPAVISVSASRKEKIYQYNVTSIYVEVIDNDSPQDFYVTRHYKAAAIDMYGRKTDFKDFSINFCNVRVGLMSEYAHNNSWPWNDDDEHNFKWVGSGQVISYSGNKFTVRINFNEHSLRRLYCDGGIWIIDKIQVHDLSGDNYEMINMSILNPPYRIYVECENCEEDHCHEHH